MDDLIAFLAARYDEAEALAQGVAHGPWHWEGGYPQRISNPAAILVAECYTSPDAPAQEAEYIAAVNPKHRLADIALKRAILAALTVERDIGFGGSGFTEGLEFAVRQLGTEFSDHRDYRAEWAPEDSRG
jgi:hypothetical protein